MTDLKHCKVKEHISIADIYAAVILCVAVVGGILILNFMPLGWIV